MCYLNKSWFEKKEKAWFFSHIQLDWVKKTLNQKIDKIQEIYLIMLAILLAVKLYKANLNVLWQILIAAPRYKISYYKNRPLVPFQNVYSFLTTNLDCSSDYQNIISDLDSGPYK